MNRLFLRLGEAAGTILSRLPGTQGPIPRTSGTIRTRAEGLFQGPTLLSRDDPFPVRVAAAELLHVVMGRFPKHGPFECAPDGPPETTPERETLLASHGFPPRRCATLPRGRNGLLTRPC